MTAPSFRAGGTATTGSFPLADAQIGDYGLIITNTASASVTASGGAAWTKLIDDSTLHITVWGGTITSNSGSVTMANTSTVAFGFYSSCSGAVAGMSKSSTGSTSIAVAAAAGSCDDVLVAGAGRTNAASHLSWTPPAKWTVRETTPSSNDVMLADMGTNTLTAQTPSVEATFTLSGTPTTAETYAIVLLPSVVTQSVSISQTVDILAGVNSRSSEIASDRPQIIAEIAFAQDPNDDSLPPFRDDVSERVMSFDAARGRPYELAQMSAGSGSLLLANKDGALDPANSSSPFYPNVTPMRKTRIIALWKNFAYPVWSGYARDFSLQWDDNHLAQSNIALVDNIAVLNGGMPPVIAAAMGASDPLHLWPLTETPSTPTSGSVTWQFSDVGSSSAPLALTVTAPNAGATISNGATIPSTQFKTPADSTEGVKVDCGSNSFLTAFSGTAGDGVSLFPLSGEIVTWEFFASSQDLTANSLHAALLALNDGTTEWLRVEAYESTVQFPEIHLKDSSGNAWQWPAVHNLADDWNGSREMNRHWIITLDGTGGVLTITIWLDKTLYARQVVPINLPAAAVTHLCLPGDNFLATHGVSLVTCAAMYQRYLGDAEIAEHIDAYGGHPADKTGDRAARLVAWADWNGGTAFDTGTSTMQSAAGLSGSTLQTQMQKCADTDFGQVYADASGKLAFAGRARLSSSTSVCTFGDGVGEIPTQGDLSFTTDPSYVYDRVTVTRDNGTTAAVYTPSATKKFFASQLDVTIRSDTDADAFDQAAYLASQYATPKLRVSSVTIDMLALCRADYVNSTDHAATVFGLDISDVVTVTRRTPTLITGDFRIEKISPTIQPDVFTLTFALSPVLDAPTW